MKKVVGLAVVLIIVVTLIARIGSVDEVNRQSRSYERNARVVATALSDGSYSRPTATPNPVAVTRVAESQLQKRRPSTPTPTPDPRTVCNPDFIGLDVRVDDAISRVYEINFAMAEEATSAEHFAELRLEAVHEIAGIWRNVGYDREHTTQAMLGAVAEAWEMNLTVAVDDGPAQLDILRAIADAYTDLSEEFEKCTLTRNFAADLEEEAQELRQLASDLG